MSDSFNPMDCSTPGFPVHHQLPELVETRVHRASDAIQLSHPLSTPLLLPSIFPSIRIFSNESVLHIGWTEYWSFSFSISPSLQDWFPLGLTGWISMQSKGLSRVFSNTTVQKHQFSALSFFMVQLSHPYITTGKTIALTRWTFVGKVMFLLCNMLSRLVIAFLSRSKNLLISWLQSPSAVILEPKKIKPVTVFTVFLSIFHEVMRYIKYIPVFINIFYS